MWFKKEFAVFSYAYEKTGRSRRPTVFMAEEDFLINECSLSELPLAFVVRSITYRGHETQESRPVDIRSYQGKLYMKSSVAARDIPSRLLGSPLDRSSRMAPFISSLISDIQDSRGELPIAPTGILEGLTRLKIADSDILYPALRDMTNRIEIDSLARDNIAKYQSMIQASLDGLIDVDGEIWRECGEPVYVVDDRGVRVHFAASGRLEHQRNSRTFSALETRDVLEYEAKTVSRGPGEIRRTAEIEVFDKDMVRWQSANMDAVAFARSLIAKVGAQVAEVLMGKSKVALGTGCDLNRSWRALRDEVAAIDPAVDDIPLSVERHVRSILRAAEAYNAESGVSLIDCSWEIENVDAIFDRCFGRWFGLEVRGERKAIGFR